MNENGYLTEKDLKFIEALKEDEKKHGSKSFFKLLFVGIAWVNEKKFSDAIKNFESPKGGFIVMIDWIFSYGEHYFIGKYKDWFIMLDNEGFIGCIGKEIQNTLDFTLDYYTDFREPDNEYRSFYSFRELSLVEELEKYNTFCAKLGLTVKINDDFDESQNEGFDYELFDNIFN